MSPRKKLADQQGGYSGTAVSYVRYSSHNQQDVSIDQQAKQCQEFAQRNNLHDIEGYAELVVSGKRTSGPNFRNRIMNPERRKPAYDGLVGLANYFDVNLDFLSGQAMLRRGGELDAYSRIDTGSHSLSQKGRTS